MIWFVKREIQAVAPAWTSQYSYTSLKLHRSLEDSQSRERDRRKFTRKKVRIQKTHGAKLFKKGICGRQTKICSSPFLPYWPLDCMWGEEKP